MTVETNKRIEQVAIIADGQSGECHRAIGTELVWIEQNAGLGAEGIHRVDDALILEAVIARIEVPSALLEGHPVAFKVP